MIVVALMVKKLMRPADGSISISRPNAPDNKRIYFGKSLALDSMGTAARCLCLDDCAHDESESGNTNISSVF